MESQNLGVPLSGYWSTHSSLPKGHGAPGLRVPHVKMQLCPTLPVQWTSTVLLTRVIDPLSCRPPVQDFQPLGDVCSDSSCRVNVLPASESWTHRPSWVYCQHRCLSLPCEDHLGDLLPKSQLHTSSSQYTRCSNNGHTGLPVGVVTCLRIQSMVLTPLTRRCRNGPSAQGHILHLKPVAARVIRPLLCHLGHTMAINPACFPMQNICKATSSHLVLV